jgi:hypothetical protein
MTEKKKDKGRPSARTEVWENLILVTAKTAEEAYRKACVVGKFAEGGCQGTLTLDGDAAVTTFLGLQNMGVVHDEIADGAEITWQLKRCSKVTAKRRVMSKAVLCKEVARELSYLTPKSARKVGKRSGGS